MISLLHIIWIWFTVYKLLTSSVSSSVVSCHPFCGWWPVWWFVTSRRRQRTSTLPLLVVCQSAKCWYVLLEIKPLRSLPPVLKHSGYTASLKMHKAAVINVFHYFCTECQMLLKGQQVLLLGKTPANHLLWATGRRTGGRRVWIKKEMQQLGRLKVT